MNVNEEKKWKKIVETFEILNVSEVCRRAGVDRHKVANALRKRGKISPQEIDALAVAIVQSVKIKKLKT